MVFSLTDEGLPVEEPTSDAIYNTNARSSVCVCNNNANANLQSKSDCEPNEAETV